MGKQKDFKDSLHENKKKYFEYCNKWMHLSKFEYDLHLFQHAKFRFIVKVPIKYLLEKMSTERQGAQQIGVNCGLAEG